MKENLPVSLQKLIHKVEETFAEDPAMVELFINCFSNTLDTTVKKMEDGTTHFCKTIHNNKNVEDGVPIAMSHSNKNMYRRTRKISDAALYGGL